MSEESKVIDQVIEKHTELSSEVKQKMKDVLIEMFEHGKTPLQAIGIDKDLIEAIYAMVYYYYNAGQTEQALKLSEMLFTLDPTDIRFSFSLAAANQLIGNYKEAFNYFFIAAQLDEDSPIPHFHMTECFLKMNQPVGAMMMIEIMLARAESNPEKYSQLIERGKLQFDQLLEETGIDLSRSKGMTVLEQIINPPKKKPT